MPVVLRRFVLSVIRLDSLMSFQTWTSLGSLISLRIDVLYSLVPSRTGNMAWKRGSLRGEGIRWKIERVCQG